jgi:hypothetical protein
MLASIQNFLPAKHESTRGIYMNTCEKCSNPVPEEKAFCPNCGAAMTPERERVTETAEGMGETMYEYQPPAKKLAAPMVPTPPVEAAPVSQPPTPKVEAAPGSKPSARESLQPGPKAQAAVSPKVAAQVKTPAVDNNQTLRLILSVSAVLFVLSILAVAVLYIMGKI